MTTHNQLIYTTEQFNTIKAIADEYLLLKQEVNFFFNNGLGKTSDALYKHVTNKPLLTAMTECFEACIPVCGAYYTPDDYDWPSSVANTMNMYWPAYDDIEDDIMNYWHGHPVGGNRSNKGVRICKSMIERVLFSCIMNDLETYAEKYNPVQVSSQKATNHFTFKNIITQSELCVEDTLLKVVIASLVIDVYKGKIYFKPELYWFINLIAAKLLES